jgi:hypothetical protein
MWDGFNWSYEFAQIEVTVVTFNNCMSFGGK